MPNAKKPAGTSPATSNLLSPPTSGIGNKQKKKNQKKKNQKQEKGKVPSHKELGERLRVIGEKVAKRLAGNYKALGLDASPDLRLRYVEKILADLDADRKPLKSDKFGGRYRGLLTEQDELVSTSSARDLLKGILDNTSTSLNSQPLERLIELMDDISKIRMPTKFVGYALSSTDRMQHPTNKAEAMFEDPGKTARRHSELDRRRRQAVVEGMEAELEGNWTPESVASAGIRAAIAFTLNEMAAPIIAANVRPHALAGGGDGNDYTEDEIAQVQAREHMKAIYVGLGGTQDPTPAGMDKNAQRGRPWNRRGGARSVSPVRPMGDLM